MYVCALMDGGACLYFVCVFCSSPEGYSLERLVVAHGLECGGRRTTGGVVVVLRGDRPNGDVIATTPIASFASMRSMTQQKTYILSPVCGDTVASPGT